MKRVPRITQVAVAMSLLASGCYGPFNLTRKLHHWNEQVGDKYVNELLFLVLTFPPFPAYGFALIGDLLLFNPIEFWTGHNPVFMSLRSAAAQTARLVHQAQTARPNTLE